MDGGGADLPSPGAAAPVTPRGPPSAASRALDWVPGRLLWHAPGVTSEWPSTPLAARESIVCDGQPVLLVDAVLSEAGTLRVTAGGAPFDVPRRTLGPISPSDVEWVARMFAHFEASISPRCDSPAEASPPVVAPLAWLTPAGLRDAGEARFDVPRLDLRHIIGRQGATIRRLEAVLGVLIGAVDGPGPSASVSVCGPPARLPDAERLIRLVGRGHWSLLGRLEEAPGSWTGGEAGGMTG